ncbi:MAG: T9SS type A sorting domain-containing protein [Thermotogae bacterium]|nr:T9SS type A sorting domain-containing protein [Thermotogota bacterium]
MLFLLSQGWQLWTNTELLLDVCRRNDTVFMATAGGLLLSDGGTILKSFTKMDGLRSTQVISVACEEGGLWVLTRGGLQYFEDGSFKDINLITFDDPEEILGARRIRKRGDFLFILGKTKPTALRLSDTVEIPFPRSIASANGLKLFGDSIVVVGTGWAFIAPTDSFYVESAWDTLFTGYDVLDVDTFGGSWVFATRSGLRDTLGNVSLDSVEVSAVLSLNDTLWIAALRALFKLPEVGGDTQRVRDGDVRFLGRGYVSFGYLRDPSYMIGLGIYRLPDMWRLKTGGLGFTSITGMVELGDSLILCGKGVEYSCAVWPMGHTFNTLFVNTLKYARGWLWIGYHGFGVKAYRPDMSDTITIRPSDLNDYAYVFDFAEFNGKLYTTAWNSFGFSKVFAIEDSTAEPTTIVGSGYHFLYSTEENLVVCSEGECKFYDGDLRPVGSIPIGANVMFRRGDTLLVGNDQGLYVVSLRTLTHDGPYLQGHQITGLWVGLDGKVWVADNTGLLILDENFNLVKSYTPENSPLAGYPVSITSYFPLRYTLLANPDENRLYISTDGGLSILTSPEVVAGWEINSLVYPNPARRGQTVRVKNCPIDARLTLYTLSGTRIKENRGCSLVVNVPPGLYMLAVVGSQGRKVLKVVVQER